MNSNDNLHGKSCGLCEAYHAFPDTSGQTGQCRRRAPIALVVRYVSENAVDRKGAVVQVLNGIVDGFFPPTNAQLYCGDFIAGVPDVSDLKQIEMPKTERIGGLVPVSPSSEDTEEDKPKPKHRSPTN